MENNSEDLKKELKNWAFIFNISDKWKQVLGITFYWQHLFSFGRVEVDVEAKQTCVENRNLSEFLQVRICSYFIA